MLNFFFFTAANPGPGVWFEASALGTKGEKTHQVAHVFQRLTKKKGTPKKTAGLGRAGGWVTSVVVALGLLLKRPLFKLQPI